MQLQHAHNMVLYGKPIADEIYKKLSKDLSQLQKNNITPTLAIIVIGSNPVSEKYVSSKKKSAEKHGINAQIIRIPQNYTKEKVKQIVDTYNNNPLYHGIIIQLPVTGFTNEELAELISKEKDVDGFLKNSLFTPPIVKTAMVILEKIYAIKGVKTEFNTWLKNQNVVVIGKGFTGGGPIVKKLSKYTRVHVIDHTTQNPKDISKQGDIIISCVGKKNIITKDSIKKGASLIGIGIYKDADLMKGDYDEDEIKDTASLYTPTPKGTGPVTVACLLENVVISAKQANRL